MCIYIIVQDKKNSWLRPCFLDNPFGSLLSFWLTVVADLQQLLYLVSNDLTCTLGCILFSVLEVVQCRRISLELHCSDRGEWESAVSKILDPRDVMRKAREYYEESNDIEGTLRQLPRHLVAERDVIVSFRLSLLQSKFLYLTS